MINKLKDKLYQQVVIFDGAIGTEIYNKGFFINTSFEHLCLTNPKAISSIHEDYISAGADVITTNSFSANSHNLSKFGLGDQVYAINKTSAQLAKNVSEDALIAGSVGPVGKVTIDLTKINIIEILKEQIAALIDGGIDFIMFETLVSKNDIECAICAINNFPETPFVISCSVDRHGDLLKGDSYSQAIKLINKAKKKPTALGFNCGEGPEGLLSALEILKPEIDYPIILQANAGMPKHIDGRNLYMTSPEYLTTYAHRYINFGVRAIGGCCGTTPAHIADISRSIKPLAKSEYTSKLIVHSEEEELLEPVETKDKSSFGEKIAAGKWVTSIEITPPRGYDLSSTVEKAIICKEAGVDAINIPDGPRASSRLSPIVTAITILEKAKIEPILHFCCRDKNLIGMQADLLGCACANIGNILFVTGDPPKLGDYPFASAVFDVDSVGMVKIQDRLNRGIDIGGKSIGGKTKTLIGVGVDPNAIDMERELKRTREKYQNGAEFIISQPVFDVLALQKFIDNIKDLKNFPFIAGIWPLASYRNAEFMKNEVPGVVVPDSIMERMAKYSQKEDQKKEGIDIARESVEQIKDVIQGVQVSAPFGNVQTALSVLK